jgi:16S rRNA (guanine966-N2)-methyltransferase
MIIIAGTHKGRTMAQPPGRTTRPLTEKVRAALFDVLGDPTGLVVLDAYAGSGAAGFEALSRGALLVEAIENHPRAARTIVQNEASLGFTSNHILHTVSVEKWLASPGQNPPAARYGLIIADPPYAKIEPDIIGKLAAFMTPEGVLALSHSSRLAPPELTGIRHVKTKTYGDTAVSFYCLIN